MSAEPTSYRRKEVTKAPAPKTLGNIHDRIAAAREQREKSRPVTSRFANVEPTNRTTSRAQPSVPLNLDSETTDYGELHRFQPANDNRQRSIARSITIATGRFFGLYPEKPQTTPLEEPLVLTKSRRI